MTLHGQCACGEARYELSSHPLFVHACHCSYCQRESGSAFILNALIETERVKLIAGATSEWMTPSASGKGQRVLRCQSCQVALWSHYAYGKLDDAITFVRVGTLDAADQMPPDIHIFTESKKPWLELPTDVPVMPGFYRASEHWPSASIERRSALFERL